MRVRIVPFGVPSVIQHMLHVIGVMVGVGLWHLVIHVGIGAAVIALCIGSLVVELAIVIVEINCTIIM